MKIGIITVYKSSNYGAYYQAMGLKEYLKEENHEVYFIKHSARKPIISLLRKIYDAVSKGDIKRGGFLLKQEYAFGKARKNFQECSLLEAKNMDLIILGSDEIWNVSRNNIRNYPIFWGKGIKNTNIISYAPSVNNATIDDFRKIPNIVEQMRSIQKISVRDKYSKEIIEKLLDRKVDLVIDPTMLHEKKHYLKMKNIDMEYKSYILVYTYGKDSKVQEMEIDKIREYARNHDLEIISIMGYLKWADKNVVVCPDEMFAYFANAEFVITDTFHGTIFSLIMEKEFYILHTTSKKVQELLEMVDLCERQLDEKNERDFLKEKIDYNLVGKKINEMRHESSQFIKAHTKKEL